MMRKNGVGLMKVKGYEEGEVMRVLVFGLRLV